MLRSVCAQEKNPELKSLIDSEREKIMKIQETCNIIFSKICLIKDVRQQESEHKQEPVDTSTVIGCLNENLILLTDVQFNLGRIMDVLTDLVG